MSTVVMNKKRRNSNSKVTESTTKSIKPTVSYEYDKYITTSQDLKATLDKFGVAIIPSVLDEKECSVMIDGMWNFFEHISKTWTIPLDRSKPETWKEFFKLMPSHAMLVQHYGIGHCQASWDIRQNEKIIDIFAQFWKCNRDQLLVSFDAASFAHPPETTGRGWNRGNTWYHTDQSYTVSGFKSVQSWVTAQDVEDGDATLSIMEGSHLYHQECAKKFNITNKSDWYKLSRKEEEFYFEHGCSYKNIKCPKGSIVFWDSRTIHCGIEATKGRLNPKSRSVIYLCYMPRSSATDKDLKKKRTAFETMRTTSHYANKAKMFGKLPQHYGKGIPEITPISHPILSSLGKKLAGF